MRENGLWHKIDGATSSSLTLSDDDAGKQVSVFVTCTDQAGHTAHLASPVTVEDLPPGSTPGDPPLPPENSPGVLNVSSTDGFNEGATLTATVIDTDGFDAAAVIYTWQQQQNGNWTDVGTGQTHTIGFNVGNNDFRVIATYTDATGNAEAPAPVVFTAVDVNRPGELTVTSTGDGFVAGSTITAHVTDPDDVDAGSISYQWASRGADQIWKPVGTNSASYTLTTDDIGNEIDVIATYIDKQGHSDSAADPFVVTAPNIPDPPPPLPVDHPGTLTVDSNSADGSVHTASDADAAHLSDQDGCAVNAAYQ